jgi:hypothetical protein
MPSYLANTKLTRGELRLYLTNLDGNPQDGFDVRWTVYASGGIQVSGKSLKAIKAKTGEYYAPWQVTDKNGNYYIEWEWQENPGYPRLFKTENLFVINPSSYGTSGPITADGVPNWGEFTYLKGSLLGRGDLPLFITDENGFPIDAAGVLWTIYDAVGNPVTSRTVATRTAVGEYYAQWYVNVISGDYLITWEYFEATDAPISTKSMRFSVIDPAYPYAPMAPIASCCCQSTFEPQCSPVILAPQTLASCCPTPCTIPCTSESSCATSVPVIPTPVTCATECCSIEIPRTVHIPTQTLAVGGACTDQPVYSIPDGVRNISFYTTYTRGAAGGYPKFKLLWGNGVEETQETMVDMNFTVLSPSTVAQDMYLQNLTGPVPDTDDPVNSILHVCVPGGATTVRLLACEEGAPATPGTIGVTLTASS